MPTDDHLPSWTATSADRAWADDIRRRRQATPDHAPGCDADCPGFLEGLQEVLNDERGTVSVWESALCPCPCHDAEP